MVEGEEKTNVTTLVGRFRIVLAALRRRPVPDQSGQAVPEYLGLAALGVAAIVVISAAMRVLGLDVVEWIRVQLGV